MGHGGLRLLLGDLGRIRGWVASAMERRCSCLLSFSAASFLSESDGTTQGHRPWMEMGPALRTHQSTFGSRLPTYATLW